MFKTDRERWITLNNEPLTSEVCGSGILDELDLECTLRTTHLQYTNTAIVLFCLFILFCLFLFSWLLFCLGFGGGFFVVFFVYFFLSSCRFS